MMNAMAGRFSTVGLIVVVLVGVLGAVRLLQSRANVALYRQKLATATDAYQQLASAYNKVVKKTAVTELLVDKGRLSVVVRTATGPIETFDTPYDPAGEIYVDYIVANGRLWIRRVYDAATPPSQGLVIDPNLARFDWQKAAEAYGKAVYRSLDDGRWIVTVTGDGSLGLARAEDPVDLAPAPPVRDFEQLEPELQSDSFGVGPAAVLRRFAMPGRVDR